MSLKNQNEVIATKKKKGANVSNKSRGPYKKSSLSADIGNTPIKLDGAATGFGATKYDTGVIKASDLSINDGVMPQSPVVDKFITKKLDYRMSKSLDNMSKQLNIGSSKSKMLNESDILIDDDIFKNEE